MRPSDRLKIVLTELDSSTRALKEVEERIGSGVYDSRDLHELVDFRLEAAAAKELALSLSLGILVDLGRLDEEWLNSMGIKYDPVTGSE